MKRSLPPLLQPIIEEEIRGVTGGVTGISGTLIPSLTGCRQALMFTGFALSGIYHYICSGV
jgi:hypothetical protein